MGAERTARLAGRGGLPGGSAVAGALGLVASAGLAACTLASARPAGSGSAGTTEQEAAGVAVARHRGYPAVPADELAGAGMARVVDGADGLLRLRLSDGEAVSLRPGSPFVRHGDRIIQMANPPYRRGGRAWIPAELFVRLLAPPVTGGEGFSVRGGRLLARGSGEEAPARTAAGARGPRAEGWVPEDGSASGPFVVVIDPGHGGRDPGTHGARGTDEKEVTLGIARKLRDRLERVDGIRTVMTREGDTLVALRDRSRMAMAALDRTYGGQEPSGGLFVSIHANAVARGNARGFESYFLGRATSEQAREVAMRENSAIRYEEEGATPAPDDVRFMLADLDKTQWIIESNRLAGYTQNSLRQRLASPDRGVKQANYLVLVWASGSMPSVLVEAGFLSDRDEARMLASDRGQEEVARGLAEAVRDYHRRYDRQIRASAARE